MDLDARADGRSAALNGLSRFQATDHTLVQDAVSRAEVTGWSYYFPYLLFFSQLSGRERVLFEVEHDALLVYRLSERSSGAVLSLLVPPFPFEPKALERASTRMKDFNAGGQQRISRVPESMAGAIARSGFELRFNADEYLYDGAQVREMAGSQFGALRRKIGKYEPDSFHVRPYTQSDRSGCKALLQDWRTTMSERGIKLGPYRSYARRCLDEAETLGEDVLRGEVIEIDGAIGAFTFGGAIEQETVSLFITISDHRHPGLAYLQRQRFISGTPDTRYFNDFVDSNRPGLAQMKRTFRPVRMQPLFSARRR